MKNSPKWLKTQLIKANGNVVRIEPSNGTDFSLGESQGNSFETISEDIKSEASQIVFEHLIRNKVETCGAPRHKPEPIRLYGRDDEGKWEIGLYSDSKKVADDLLAAILVNAHKHRVRVADGDGSAKSVGRLMMDVKRVMTKSRKNAAV